MTILDLMQQHPLITLAMWFALADAVGDSLPRKENRDEAD